MTTRPIHSLSPAPPLARWRGIRPLGLEAPGSIRVGPPPRNTYWEIKVRWLSSGHLTEEQLAFIGALDPYPPDRSWRSQRGWRSAEDVTRSVSRDEEREVEARGVRWLLGLGDTRAELTV